MAATQYWLRGRFWSLPCSPDPYCETPMHGLAWMSGYALPRQEPCFSESVSSWAFHGVKGLRWPLTSLLQTWLPNSPAGPRLLGSWWRGCGEGRKIFTGKKVQFWRQRRGLWAVNGAETPKQAERPGGSVTGERPHWTSDQVNGVQPTFFTSLSTSVLTCHLNFTSVI